MAAEVPTPSLSGRRAQLRPLHQSDFDFLYQLAGDEEVGFRWRTRGLTPAPYTFLSLLWNGVDVQFVVVDSRTERLVGLVSAYGADTNAGHVRVAMMVAPDVMRSGWIVEAAILFIDYLFAVLNLRKIYFDVPGFNYETSLGRLGRLFRTEGTLVDHNYYAGRYWDQHILALYRDDWSALAERAAAFSRRGASP
ncbi:spermidine N1-acetyltransferase [soil metagenome]